MSLANKIVRNPLPAMVLSAAAPVLGHACAACAAGDPKNSATYLSMTIMMSATPLIMLGGLIYWLRRRY